MASHGVARIPQPTLTQDQREQQATKIRAYQVLDHQVRTRVSAGLLDADTFSLTTRLLQLNPEYYTIWNVRRRCLASPSAFASCPSSDTIEPSALGLDEASIRSELAFTIPLLLKHPKCYWIWNYRLWILDQAIKRLAVHQARSVWQDELALVSKLLHKDRRNFHAWGYRRHVVSHLESPALQGDSMAESEFDYTTAMISEDLSNFSAWHNRSQLIPRLLHLRAADAASRKDFLYTELDLVHEALNVGPEDQSLWYYHRYLVSNISAKGDIAPDLSLSERKACLEHDMFNTRDLCLDYDDINFIYEALIQGTLILCKLEDQPIDSQNKEQPS
ncbi:hypothetical protein CDD81_8156 [Ophiocordyceps australis]|uniref:Geranylgeranyl transferase type-2 subunit alpha n=1 Tax=Ophiocordyceps australis TaxID=1399860 RepID=A0A2C5XWD5_9HYPO|nr:hypothetical protein CDD81_8156 [Ophiocordyceps australis]